MLEALLRFVLVVLLAVSLGPRLKARLQAQIEDGLSRTFLTPALLQPLTESLESLQAAPDSSNREWRVAASNRKSLPVIRIPPLTRTRLVQATPIDPRAVPSMQVSSQN